MGLDDPIFPRAGNGGCDAQHYILDLTMDMDENILDAKVTMTAKAIQALSAFNLDFAGFTIDNVMVNAQPAILDRVDRELTKNPSQPLSEGERFTTEIMRTYYDRYKNANADTMDFIGLAEEVSGQDLEEFFKSWLYEERIPDILELGLTVNDPDL